MLNPSSVIAKLITDIKAIPGYATLGLDDVIEINEKPSQQVKPPYIGLYFDYDRPATNRNTELNLLSVPFSIYALIFSRQYSKAADAFAEAFNILNTIQSALVGIKTIGTQKVFIRFDSQPYSIMAYTADQTVLRINCYCEEYL